MTDALQQSVVLVGLSPAVHGVFKGVLTSCSVGVRQLSYVNECRDSLARENRNLLVGVELHNTPAFLDQWIR